MRATTEIVYLYLQVQPFLHFLRNSTAQVSCGAYKVRASQDLQADHAPNSVMHSEISDPEALLEMPNCALTQERRTEFGDWVPTNS